MYQSVEEYEAAEARERLLSPAVEAMRRKSYGINAETAIPLAVEALIKAGFTITARDGTVVTLPESEQ